MDHSIKSRPLKKYEAGPDMLRTQGENPAMALYSPFGPMIAKVKSPPALLDRIMENTTVSRAEYENFWILSQYAGTPSPVHFHTGDISGVMYLTRCRRSRGGERRSLALNAIVTIED